MNQMSRRAMIGAMFTCFVVGGCGSGTGVVDTSPIPKSPYAPTQEQLDAMAKGMSKLNKRARPASTKGTPK